MNKVTELRPKTGGGSSRSNTCAIIVEVVTNGYIVRFIEASEEPGETIEDCQVYMDRGDLMREIAAKL